ncbi:MAG: hypothetical protein E7336_05855 [Clostridiales bacterium]|nr:hypothetical protein [Clostridiales bacterium]
MTKVISAVLILSLLCSCVFSYAVAEEITPRASDYFTSYGTSMSAPGGGGINITFRAVGTDICNQIGVANYCVQKLNNDGNWEYCSGALSGQTGTNVASYTFGRYFQGVAGETYRIQVTFLCTINNSTETKSYTSGRITAE